jgi:hypothetical protein
MNRVTVSAGDRYGRLVVVEEVEPAVRTGRTRRAVRCLCDCGNEVVVLLNNMRVGDSSSCGCLHSENSITHGRTIGGKPGSTYQIWKAMRQRCTNPSYVGYSRYGGRGISVCERWNSFELFLEDMGERPSGRHSIDRRNNDGNYEPGNCRWATRTEQNRNSIKNRLITLDGITRCLSEWGEFTGIPADVIRYRLDRLGWAVEDALTRPLRGAKR